MRNNKKIFETLENFLVKNKLENFVKLDHVCFKCVSKKEYEDLRKKLETKSKFFYQAIVSNRRIGIVKYPEAIKTKMGACEYLELSDYEADETVRGWHHIEIQVKNIKIEKFLKLLENTGVSVVHGGAKHHKTHYFYVGKFKYKITKESILEIIQRDMSI